MVGGTIRRKLIHRESFRASVLHHSEEQSGGKTTAQEFCALTTPSLLSRGTRHKPQGWGLLSVVAVLHGQNDFAWRVAFFKIADCVSCAA